MPTPRPGQILGLVGTNGIGKSTALKILAGKLKPNLGQHNNPPDWEEILRYFRGSELQNYFTKVLEDNLKAVVKPQYVDHIPRTVSGPVKTVKELLDSKLEKNNKDEIIDILDLKDILNREIDQLSGGELQRFAIAIVSFFKKIKSSWLNSTFQSDVCKPLNIENIIDQEVQHLSGGELQRVAIVLCLGLSADIYLIDEPSAYLDSEQRIVVSKVIKRFMLHSKKTAFVVEHDFIMATYLADRVIVYKGQPSIKAYTNAPQSLIDGMNSFLSNLDVTLRRDPNTFRPRINKYDSQMHQEQKNLKRPISVGVVGYPNVGKSSIINALVSSLSGSGKKKPCATGSEASTTTSTKQVKLDNQIKLIDSPGIVFPSKNETRGKRHDSKAYEEAKLVLINAIPPSNIIDPIYTVSQILYRLHSDPTLYKELEEFYNLPPILSTNDDIATDFLIHIARKKGRLGKGGVPQLESAAKAVINDWCAGRIRWWTQVPKKGKADGVSTHDMSSTMEDPIIVTEWAKEFTLDE
ncbi:hypothetical protein PCK2_000481 [Pneumocystis canis]|nr:hypothetical protein PCK2_000481 [Pneumocystis canis]